ncbi:YoaK family protein [Amycolatopsis pigmentata]|uniref:YoaK family protein n=1 Tax=Amycolatopsis pigmentata TaxID=450801 RepID=A0ABW5G3G4_9PSEU
MSERSHGPLPVLLVVLTLVTGLVDGVSFLGLGRVFVANQTGNVVLLGFAVGGAPGLSVPVSLAALGSFLLGALVGGRLRADRGRLLALGAAVEAALAAVALSAAFLVSTVYGAVVPLGLAMGVQNAVVRRLGVPHLNTTVLTTTLTGLFSEPIFGDGTRAGRRLTSVLALFAGAAAGGALVTFTGLRYPIGLAVVLLAVVSVTSYLLARRGGEWLATS